MIPLCISNLALMPETIKRPAYDRADLRAGILHIGVGNFHRAHMAVYLDTLFNMGLDHDWAIIGAGLRQADSEMREKLAGQDWLSTVVDTSDTIATARITGSMIEFCKGESQSVLDRLKDPNIRIVSLTITEGGYYLDSAGQVNTDHPDILHDSTTPNAPMTVFGVLIAALRNRRDAGQMPFTILSCDNLPGNGDVTRNVITTLASQQDPELARWINAKVAFPNAMVDCITPKTGPGETVRVQTKFGIIDQAPVVCEPFRQWVIEDHFPAGRPALEHVGVEFVKDVRPHEIMKLRLLNASHASLAYAALLMGYEFIHQALEDKTLFQWVRQLAIRETIPTLPPLQGVDYTAYLDRVLTRFQNPAIADTNARSAASGSDRQSKFILPTVSHALAQDTPIQGLALEISIWAYFCRKPPILLEDTRASQLAEAARSGPRAFLAIDEVFGPLGQNERLIRAVCDEFQTLETYGVAEAITRYLSDHA